MKHINNATLIRRELMIRIAKIFWNNEDPERLDRIPVEMFPRRSHDLRCCIYKDRAILKYRIMALLGFAIEEEEDELTRLSDYARQAGNRELCDHDSSLTVIDEACSSCVRNNYYVTNACRGCLARPCVHSCPRQAISVINGQAVIDEEQCVNCGLCQKACPYHAIIRMTIPCENTCPVDAISKDAYGKETIDREKCINCGRCVQNCPYGAIMERSRLVDCLLALQNGNKLSAMIAPAVIGQFSASIGKVISALRQLGFASVFEVAEGAEITADRESAEWKHRVLDEEQAFLTSSCCPAYMSAVQKHIPELKPFVSDTASPMEFTARKVRERHPEQTTVFIGPCTAKRQEAADSKNVDLVLTFEELGALFVAAGIDVQACSDDTYDEETYPHGQAFPESGGVSKAIQDVLTEENPELAEKLKGMQIDGLDAKAIKKLQAFSKGKCPANFLEVMACEGGCLGGPATLGNPKVSGRELHSLLERIDKSRNKKSTASTL